ncbi:outer membrane receptor proteins, mostly Fe transport [Nitrosomonas sp. PY1]|uniref:TonB-dependent receptor n=1 Tax=Nitrosomonas sp. PY1 TaxID=1803906 RepID=UPI001FC864E6|nr:TonB-dependent receptor [Nitrosomonas sp. PY1]GKS69086.1 outer membrane receptor proteins, mostly Fe transport [Nitrosomonas sp. PY1]
MLETTKKNEFTASGGAVLLSLWMTGSVHAAGVPTLNEMTIKADSKGLIGTANTASEGTVLKRQLDSRTVYRPGELMETVPGFIATQHSGEGKANQYFMRGFNLDHGTDVRISVDGVLVNQRSHGHGQGWADVNFIIPELISNLQYTKGPYYANQGDFASAGSINMNYVDKLPQGIATYGIGQQGWMRGLLAKSFQVGSGNLLVAGELVKLNGPWTIPEHFKKYNAMARYSQDDGTTKFNITAMAYGARWTAIDQIPLRGVRSGYVSRLGAIDPSDYGETHRFSLSSALEQKNRFGVTTANLYTIHHNMALFSNFTYFLEDPVNGDQFSQKDKRFQSGFNVDHTWVNKIYGFDVVNSVGVQFQNDVIDNGLSSTRDRHLLSRTRADHINENSVGLYYQNSVQWLEKFRTVTGIRSDYYWFDVNSHIQKENSGSSYDSITNPKVSAIFGPWANTEFYFSYGSGFHSNDARGTTSRVDPKTNEPINPVHPLVRTTGYEVGVRSAIVPGLQTTFSLFRLDTASELLFVGDAGNTEASRPSQRNGFEVSAFYMPKDWLTIDVDYALTRARFSDFDPIGNHVPGAINGVGKLAVSVDNLGRFLGSMQVRYFGKRALTEDNSARSDNTVTLNGQVGYKVSNNVHVVLQGFNLLNTHGHAIDYFYTSRLPGEPVAGVADKHFHPVETRSFRVNLVANF